jgi:hypothetical protein
MKVFAFILFYRNSSVFAIHLQAENSEARGPQSSAIDVYTRHPSGAERFPYVQGQSCSEPLYNDHSYRIKWAHIKMTTLIHFLIKLCSKCFKFKQNSHFYFEPSTPWYTVQTYNSSDAAGFRSLSTLLYTHKYVYSNGLNKHTM